MLSRLVPALAAARLQAHKRLTRRATQQSLRPTTVLDMQQTDCYKRKQRRGILHNLGLVGRGTRRNYKPWGTKCR